MISPHPISGDGLYKDLENDIVHADKIRKEICAVNHHRSDPEQLKKFKDLFLE
jgi:hypothetical protein